MGYLFIALFGTSRQLAVTSTSSSAALLAALVAPMAMGDSARYIVLASAAAIAAGLIFLLAGRLKLGTVSEFISSPVLKGIRVRPGTHHYCETSPQAYEYSQWSGKFRSSGAFCVGGGHADPELV